MIAFFIPENSSDADLSRLARMIMSFFEHWNLPSGDQTFVLGLAPGNRAGLTRYRKVSVSVRRERTTNVSGIFSAFTGAFVCCSHAIGTWCTAGWRCAIAPSAA